MYQTVQLLDLESCSVLILILLDSESISQKLKMVTKDKTHFAWHQHVAEEKKKKKEAEEAKYDHLCSIFYCFWISRWVLMLYLSISDFNALLLKQIRSNFGLLE